MSSSKPSRRSSPPSSSTTVTTYKIKSGSKPNSSSSSSSTGTKRLLQELSQIRSSEKESLQASAAGTGERSPIDRIGPVDDESLFHWEAVINGRGLGGGYEGGRWLLDIRVPDGKGSGGGKDGGKGGGSYPNAPPTVRFVTRILAANVGFEVRLLLLLMLRSGPVFRWSKGLGRCSLIIGK